MSHITEEYAAEPFGVVVETSSQPSADAGSSDGHRQARVLHLE